MEWLDYLGFLVLIGGSFVFAAWRALGWAIALLVLAAIQARTVQTTTYQARKGGEDAE